MAAAFRCRFLAFVVAAFAFTTPCEAANANWITIKNDTGKTIVVQETLVVNGVVKRGKATNLLAGETLREFVPGPTTKRIEVFDAQNPKQSVWDGELSCKDESTSFSVAGSGGKVTVTAAKK